MYKNKFIKLIWLLLLTFNLTAQSTDAGITGNNFLATKFLGWNNTNGTNPLFTRTNNINRMRLNGNQTQNISVYNTNNVNGYLGLGTFIPAGGTNYWNNNSPFSQLHIVGRNGTFIQASGYRPWMQTGVTFTDNQDLSYMGLRRVGNINDLTETVIAWADNWGPPVGGASDIGPDDLCFRFTSQGNDGDPNNNVIINNLADPFDLDGLHVSRFSSSGLIGFGNTFGVNAAGTPLNLYIRPMSLLHLSYQMRGGGQFEGYGFQQITYRRPLGSLVDIIGQGEEETDGLRLGIDNQVWGGANPHLNSYLRWQEASSFIIQTENDNSPNIEANERMRVTSIGALNVNYTGAQYFGLNATTDATRISISESGNNPLLRPKSLLHIGYDYGNIGGAGIQGYRLWMDLGVLTSNNRDHVWIGLKQRNGVNIPVNSTVTALQDNLDAVVAWGTDRVATSPAQVDNMRFIFTGHPFDANPEQSPSTQEDGLEMMRMYPATVYQHYVYNTAGNIIDSLQAYGRIGVGDFTATGVNEQPTQKLDVVGNGRFRYLPDSTFIADSLVNKIVLVDESGVLRWISKDSLFGEDGLACWDIDGDGIQDATEDSNGDGLWNFLDCQGTVADAHNGASQSSFDPSKVAFGQTIGQAGNPAILLNTREVPMNNQNIVFTVPGSGPNPTGNNIGIGTANPTSQLHIKSFTNVGTEVPLRVDDGNNNLSVAIKDNQRIGIGTANPQASLEIKTLQGSGIAPGIVMNSESNFPSNYLSFQQNNLPKFVIGHYNDILNIGAGSQNAPDSYINMSTITQTITLGKDVLANNNVQINGNLNVSGNANVSGLFTNSDAMFKTNIEDISSPLGIINQLQARKYYFDTTSFNEFAFEEDLQYGFIAQELEQVLPDLVENRTSPVQYDSLGNQISIPYTYKSVEYQEIIPIAVGAIQELSSENDSLRNVVTNLNDRLSALENCLSALLPTLCQMNQQAIQANTPQAQEQLRKDIAVTLTNRSTIILDQNVPNPFAEQTVINFSIPETVKKAQIHFYNQEGRIIQTVDVIERGLGSITVFGADLSSGVYTYTLVADGQIVSTKKMMKM